MKISSQENGALEHFFREEPVVDEKVTDDNWLSLQMALILSFSAFFCMLSSIMCLSSVQQKTQHHPSCQQSKEDCVCSSASLTDDFSELFMVSNSIYHRNPDVIKNRVQAFQCGMYVPLPSTLNIQIPNGEVPARLRRKYYRVKRDTSEKLEHRSRTRRQLSMGYPTRKKFEAVITSIPKHSNHHYVPLGGEVTLHCYNEDIGVQEEVFGTQRTFEWAHLSGKPVTSPLVNLDKLTGDLTFHSVRLADTDIFTCTVLADDNGQRMEMKKFESQIDVVAEKSLWLRFGIAYSTDHCRHKELLVMQDHLMDWIQTYVCHFCPVRNVSVNCVDFGEGGKSADKFVQLQFALSTIGFEGLVVSWSHYSELCPIDCMEMVHTKLLTILLASLMKLFRLQINVELGNQKSSVYVPHPDTIDEDIMKGCPPGFFVNYNLCFPCPTGKFSPDGKSECFPCATGYFQPNLGSSACVPCPKGYSTSKTGSVSQASCVTGLVGGWADWFVGVWMYLLGNWVLMLLVCVAALILLICLIIVCCCGNSTIGRILRCVPCCGSTSTDDDPDKERLIHEDELNEKEQRLHTFTHGERKPKHIPKFHYHETEDEYNDNDRSFKWTSKKEAATPVEELVPANPNFVRSSPSPPKSSQQMEEFQIQRQRLHPPLPMPMCTRLNRQRQKIQEEKLRNPPIYAGSSDDADNNEQNRRLAGTSTQRLRHLVKFGNALGKSKSLEAKLAQQRRKLGEDTSTTDDTHSITKKAKKYPSRIKDKRWR